MTTLSPKHIIKRPAGRISARVMYALIIVVAVIFCAFYLVGFDVPYEENPVFNAPLLTDAVVGMIYLFVLAAAVASVCSIINGRRHRDRSSSVVNGIPVARITAVITILTIACMALTFVLGSSEPMAVNGTRYTDTFWLRTTDMLINTAIIMLFIAVCGVIFGLSGYNRKIKLGKWGRL